MVNITVIGHTGRGKTTLVKKYIKDRKQIIYDTNNEYKELGIDNSKPSSRVTDLDPVKFVKLCLDKRNTVCVWEDATGFIEGRLSADFRKALVSKRHTGNVNIMIFHSILSVPPRLIQLSDFIVIFWTGDEDYQVEKKYPSLLSHWREVIIMSVKNPYAYKIIKR